MMLPQNYNVAFEKAAGKTYNFKFGIRVTIKMQTEATMVVGWLGCGGDKSLKNQVSATECIWNAFLLLVSPSSVRTFPWRMPAEARCVTQSDKDSEWKE